MFWWQQIKNDIRWITITPQCIRSCWKKLWKRKTKKTQLFPVSSSICYFFIINSSLCLSKNFEENLKVLSQSTKEENSIFSYSMMISYSLPAFESIRTTFYKKNPAVKKTEAMIDAWQTKEKLWIKATAPLFSILSWSRIYKQYEVSCNS